MQRLQEKREWRGWESNPRHHDFQLPQPFSPISGYRTFPLLTAGFRHFRHLRFSAVFGCRVDLVLTRAGIGMGALNRLARN